MAFDLLILDCDGVLIDSEVLAIQAFCTVLNAAGVPATEAMVLGCFGMKQADTLARIAAVTGRPVPADVGARIWPATRQAFERGLVPMPGVETFLRTLEAVRICVASSSHPERIRTSLDLTGLSRFFGDALFSSHQVVRGKPAPDLFLHAAAVMGVAPGRCLVVEDSAFGITGACAAGMTAIGFIGGSHLGPDHGDTLLAAGASAVAPDWPSVTRLLAA